MTSRIAHIRRSGLTGVAALSVLATLGLTACSDSTSGSGSAAAGSSSSSGSSGSSGSSAAASAAPADDVAALVSQLAKGTAEGTTVHITLDIAGAGAASGAGNGEGDIKTAEGGKAEAFSFDVGSGDTSIALLYVDGTGYVKLPSAQQSDPSKPWAKVSDTSSNPAVAALSKAFDQVNTQTSLSQYATLVKGASNFQSTGSTQVDGQQAQGYSFDIDPSSLPNASELGSAVSQIGPIPTTMAVDSKGRPLQVVEKVTVSGQTITTTITFSDYGKNVDISAPPADQTSTG